MPKMKLTDPERMILANQYEILGLLKKDTDHYGHMAEVLRDGHEWLYEQYFDVLSENLPQSDAEHVLKILGIYGDLRASFDKLSDTSGIEKSRLDFPGFDGNNEAELLSFCSALRKASRFEDTIGPVAKNSHMPTTDMYSRMIQAWESLGKPTYPYSKDQILSILNARVHPSNK